MPTTFATTRPGIKPSQDFYELARLEWKEATGMGFPHDLTDDDRAYQQRCFARAEDYHSRALEAAAKGE